MVAVVQPRFDVFVSHNWVDMDKGVRAFADRLEQLGLRVFVDDRSIETFEPITEKVNAGIAASLALISWFSEDYPRSRACQLELKAAYVSAQAAGEVADRVLVLNPVKGSFGHIHPTTLRDALIPLVDDAPEAIVAKVEKLRARRAEPLGSLAALREPTWLPQRRLGSTRFVGRMVEQWDLHERLQAGRTAQTSREPTREEVALVGFGGSGKSLLAEEYAHSFGAAYPGGIYALSAAGAAPGSESALLDQLIMIAGLLGVSLDDKPDPDLLRHLVGEKLAEGERALWLVDDVPEGLTAAEAQAWAAPHAQAATLITTRSGDYAAFARVQLDVLDEASAIQLLTAGNEPAAAEEKEAARVIAVELLGRYAQAVDVAGCQIRLRQGASAYREFVNRARTGSTIDRLEHAAELTGELPNGHEASIVKTLWDAIEPLDEDARDLLRLASQLAVEPIDLELAAQITNREGETAAAAADRIDGALSGIERTSLGRATVTPANESAYLVHTLIAATGQHIDTVPERTGSFRAKAVTILQAWLADNAGRFHDQTRAPELQSRLTHARRLAANLGATDDPSVTDLASWVARVDYMRGLYGPARRLGQEVLEAKERLLGGEHPSTLTAKGNLAATMQALGELDGARGLQEEVLEAEKRLLGDDDLSTLASQSNLAQTLRELGELDGARRLQEDVLEREERLLGGDHPETLASKGNLAQTLWALGDLDRARRLQEEALEALERLLGGDHPDTLTAKNNLAATLVALGELDGARRLNEEVLEARERLLGGEHPDTLISRGNLAQTLSELGDLNRARRLQEEVLEARERVLGTEHVETLRSKSNLAGTLVRLGELDGARRLQEEVLEARARLLGGEHPDTLTSKSILAQTLSELGDLDGARRLQEEALEAQESRLGPEQRGVLVSKTGLAVTLYRQGDLYGARRLLAEVVGAQERLLGGEHPDTLTSKGNLAAILAQLGDLNGARRLLEEVVGAQERLLGGEHPDTLTSKGNLAAILAQLGDLNGARRLLAEVVGAQERLLGGEHPDTLTSKGNLAETLVALGDLDGARRLQEELLQARKSPAAED